MNENSTIETLPFTTASAGKEPLHGRIYSDAEKKETVPLVVIIHGFKGFMDWGFFPHTARSIAESGAIAITFNMSLCGVKPGEDTFAEAHYFRKNTISREIADLNTLLDTLRDGALLPPNIEARWNGELILLGHSRGGGVALIAGSRRDDIAKIVTWAAVSKFDRYTKRQIQEWQTQGSLQVVNSRTGETLAMDIDYWQDLEKQGEELKPTVAISRSKMPILLLHGAIDLTVTVGEVHTLAGAQKNNNCTVKVLEKTNHTFHAVHPFAGETPPLKKAISHTIQFIHS